MTQAVNPAAILSGLPQPMPEEGELASTWRKWKKRFMIYLKATRQAGNDTPGEVKTSLLLHAIGAEGQEAYETFTFAEGEDKEDVDVVLSKFESFYIPKTNITCERYGFFTRSQEPGESIDHYVTALRKLAQTCDFGDIRDSLIRDRIMLGVADMRTTKRLLAAGDPDLTKALEICRSEELAATQRKRMEADTKKVNVDLVQEMEDDEEETEAQVSALHHQGSRTNGRNTCGRCGRKHPPRKCPAWGKTCMKSQRSNHFSAMCRTKTVSTVVKAKKETSQKLVESEMGPGKGEKAFDWKTGRTGVSLGEN